MLKRVNSKFTEKEHFPIGKYTAINGPSAAMQEFHLHLKIGED